MEIDADLDFQRRDWAAQRVGWLLIAIAILAALAGVFGTGPLSGARAQGDGLRLDYERFVRLQQPTKVRFALAATSSNPQLAVSRRYLDSLQIEQVTPEPKAVESAGAWLIYRFAGTGPLAVTFVLKPDAFGAVTGAAQTAGGAVIAFQQFIYP